MLELLLCSLLTILPDYLYRRYVQGKRIGKEITLFSVWFELRWGIVSCLMLTVGLITMIFYFHPSTTSVTSFFRTVPISPETNGRVAEIYRQDSAIAVEQGRADLPARQLAAGSGGRDGAAPYRRDRCGDGRSRRPICSRPTARSSRPRPPTSRRSTNCETKEELNRRNADIVAAPRDRAAARCSSMGRQAGIDAAIAAKQAVEMQALDAAAGSEGERRGRARAGAGRTGQDRHPRRRDRAGRAVRAAGRRHRQSDFAAGRRPDPGRRGRQRADRRLRADRSAGHAASAWSPK